MILDEKDLVIVAHQDKGFYIFPNYVCRKHFTLCRVMVNSPEKKKVEIVCPECDPERWKKLG